MLKSFFFLPRSRRITDSVRPSSCVFRHAAAAKMACLGVCTMESSATHPTSPLSSHEPGPPASTASLYALPVCSDVPPVCSAPVAWSEFGMLSLALGLVRWQVTGGSLKESREALEIAETDGKPCCPFGAYSRMSFFVHVMCLM